MSIPAIIEGRRLWPKARISVLGKKHHGELLRNCSFVDEFYEFNADPFSLRRSPEVKELQNWLNGAGFDAAIALLGDQFAHMLTRAGIPIRVGVKGTPLQAWLTHTYDIGSPRTWGRDERLNSLRCLGLEVGGVEPQLWAAPEAIQSSRTKLSEIGLSDGEKYAVLHPFGSTPRQWWDLSKLPALVEGLHNEHGLRSVLVGKRYDLNGVMVEPKFEMGSELLINALERFSLSELVAVIEQAELVVTTDSGPFHIAGALRKPTVGLFRARRPEHADAYSSATVVLGRNENCQRECAWDECRADPCRQMVEISEGDVLETAEYVLSNHSTASNMYHD